jgi:hypothetical protein
MGRTGTAVGQVTAISAFLARARECRSRHAAGHARQWLLPHIMAGDNARRQFGVAPETRTSSVTLGNSAAWKAANSSAVLPMGS